MRECILTEDTIFGFFGSYRFLSNYHICNVEYNGVVFQTTEAAYQAAKFTNPQVWKIFAGLRHVDCRIIGQSIVQPSDWKVKRIRVMFDVNQSKYKDATLRELLQNTGNRRLVEANDWGDVFWGTTPDGAGQSILGNLLMCIRDSGRRSIAGRIADSILIHDKKISTLPDYCGHFLCDHLDSLFADCLKVSRLYDGERPKIIPLDGQEHNAGQVAIAYGLKLVY